jgi:hypothetical protein
MTRIGKQWRILAAAALLLTMFAHAQQPAQIVRVGIPPMGNTTTRSINAKLQRDWLVRAFQPDKKKKGKREETVRLEAVALQNQSPADALGEARKKNCDYVLFTTLVELREPGDRQPRNQPAEVKIGRDPLSANPDPTVMHDPVHYAVVDYRLERVGSLSVRAASSISGEMHDDENGTVHNLLFMIVNYVRDELREP